MVNYIRAEFYKILHRRMYIGWTFLITLISAGGLVAGFAYTNSLGNSVGFAGGVDILIMMFIIGVYLTLVTGDMVFSDQYKYNTLKNEVSYGISRACIYFGKFLVSCIVSIVFCTVIMAFYLGLCALLLPHDPIKDGEVLKYLAFCVLNALPLWLGAQAMVMLCLSFFQNANMASFVFIGVIMLLPTALKLLGMLIDPVFITIREYMLATPFDSQWVLGDWVTFAKNCAIGAGWFIAATVAGYVAFQKREIS